MRMRKKKHGGERLAACGFLFYDTAANPFEKEQELHLEIGCGKGSFIVETARRHPEINFIALEKISDVLLLAMERTAREGLTNVRFLNCDAQLLPEKLPPHCLSRIYLNFSDPWPKKGHAKRRLTHRRFLEIYRSLLTEEGAVFQKTDNTVLFDFSLEEFAACGFRLENVTRDLHNSIWEQDNVHTEYEDHFSEMGFSINRLEAYIESPSSSSSVS